MPRSHFGASLAGKKTMLHQALKALDHMFIDAAGTRAGQRILAPPREGRRDEEQGSQWRTEDNCALLLVALADVVGPGEVGRCGRTLRWSAREAQPARRAWSDGSARTLASVRDAREVEREEDA